MPNDFESMKEQLEELDKYKKAPVNEKPEKEEVIEEEEVDEEVEDYEEEEEQETETPEFSDEGIDTIREKMNRMAARQNKEQGAPTVPITEKKIPTVTEEEMESLTAAQLNKMIEEAAKPTFDVNEFMRQQREYTEARIKMQEFYLDNRDLAPYSDYVMMKVNEITKTDPDITWNELFKQLDSEVRSELRLPKDSKTKKKVPTKKPFKKQMHARTPAAKAKSKLQKDLDELSPNRMRY